ncbi:hypothetical protein PPL_07120 [Heterostelium album PN500]|uniref:Kelch repeat-containing protein n=1 Tax=Heterostelium pallidum (strain ATCC 26659 / Pp 5 / PN500) TaxID=670386 RepID=D3BEG1_HETP5|nr:hypothetical protein PPL_07120 [Heterostelium album PN500]EFA80292.1 hypothetical protein PPL_07120 [Heterostelium album PN500]|eukprot:XP_020432412.1 hypothetical protein PPL_07120 [Heterostelium album PN500]
MDTKLRWKRLTPNNAMQKRGGHSATLIGQKLYIFGGCAYTNNNNQSMIIFRNDNNNNN